MQMPSKRFAAGFVVDTQRIFTPLWRDGFIVANSGARRRFSREGHDQVVVRHEVKNPGTGISKKDYGECETVAVGVCGSLQSA
jgi:hypothetical protein